MYDPRAPIRLTPFQTEFSYEKHPGQTHVAWQVEQGDKRVYHVPCAKGCGHPVHIEGDDLVLTPDPDSPNFGTFRGERIVFFPMFGPDVAPLACRTLGDPCECGDTQIEPETFDITDDEHLICRCAGCGRDRELMNQPFTSYGPPEGLPQFCTIESMPTDEQFEAMRHELGDLGKRAA